MGKENLKGMSNLNIASVAEVDSPFGGERVDIVDYSLLNFEEVISEVARRSCVPGKKIYNNDSEVTKDPIKAIGDVSISYEHALGTLPSNIDNKRISADPVVQIIETAAKLETAKQNLNLTSKQKETFDGVQGNLKGVLGWISGMVASIKEPELRRRAFTYLVLVPEVITMTGCVVKGINNPEILPPSASPAVEVATATAVPGVIEVNPTNPVTSPTETQVPIMIGGGYPTSESGFILNAGGSETEARDRIVALGAEDDLKALEDMYKEELLRTKKDPSNYTFEAMVWEGHGKVFWDSVVKDSSGKFMGFKLTEGPEKDLTVRAFGLTRYLLDYGPKDDFFDMFTLSNPPEFPDATQQMVWDNSGWHVVGLFTKDGTYLGWFNADKGPAGEWQIKESLNSNLYRVVDGKIQESKSGNWVEVETPLEIGPIKEVKLYEGKMYGIDQFGRKMFVRKDSGEWERNYLTLDEFKQREAIDSKLDEIEESEIKKYMLENKRIGLWGKNLYQGDSGSINFMVVTKDPLLDFTKKPILVNLPDNQNMLIYVGMRLYYLDNVGQLKSTITPVVLDNSNGYLHVNTQCANSFLNYRDWDKENLYEETLNIPASCNIDLLAGKKYSEVGIKIYPDNSFLPDFSNINIWLDSNKNDPYYEQYWFSVRTISEYNKMYSNQIKSFVENGGDISVILALQPVVTW